MRIAKKTIDSFVIYAVMIQPLLIMIQQVMIFVLGMSEDSTTIYRVGLTVLPMFMAIVICASRRPRLFAISYLVFFALILLTMLLFPASKSYMINDAIRFTLPIVISSTLCLVTIGDLRLCEWCLYRMSWVIVAITVFFVFSLLSGRTVFSGYNMSLSYALLLPTLSLYTKKTRRSLLAAAFLAIVMLALGSRGAFFSLGLFVVYDALFCDRRVRLPLLILFLVFLACLPFLIDILDGYGISPRTLLMLLSGNGGELSGRETLYETMVEKITETPLWGVGLYGDRPLFEGTYCHNFFLEVVADFGLVLGPTLIVGLSAAFFYVWYRLGKRNRQVLIKYFCAGFVPLMTSGSYLIEYSFGIFVGVFLLFAKHYFRFTPGLPSDNVRRKSASSYN